MASAADLGVARGYASFAEMALRESRRKDGIEAVAIVTPNHLHAPAAEAFLKAGIHVICDKPVTTTSLWRGISRSIFFRLWVRAPRILMVSMV